jgi:hypothetical protein
VEAALKTLTRADVIRRVLEDPRRRILDEIESKLNVAYFTFSKGARAVESRVRLNPLDSADLDSYIASDLWRDKAGAYGVQDDPSVVAEVKGSRSNVMGLPMEAIAEMLELC